MEFKCGDVVFNTCFNEVVTIIEPLVSRFSFIVSTHPCENNYPNYVGYIHHLVPLKHLSQLERIVYNVPIDKAV